MKGMDMSTTLRLCIVLLAIHLSPLGMLCAGEQGKTTRKPNILLILSDDLGYADIGVHGCKDIPTPNLDRIAARGVRFTDAYANGSFCTPTRAALLSGKYQQRVGCEDLTRPLPRAVVTLPQRLQAAGYATFMVGKWHLGTAAGFTPLDRGFDHFFGFLGGGHFYQPGPNQKGEYAAPILRDREPLQEKRYLTDAFGDEAAAFVAAQKNADRPFFLYLAFNAVHTPMQASDKHLASFAKMEDPRRRTYAAMLSAMDQAIGQVLKQLEEIGQLDNTVIIFTNDNGGPTTRNAVNGSRNFPLRGSKCETFQGGIRVPLLIQWNGKLQPGAVYRRPVITMDLTATALALAGADRKDIEGIDLLPYLEGNKDGSPHEVLYWRSRTMSNNYGVRKGNWMFVHSTEGAEVPGPKQTPGRDMLFNLAEDIGEKNDLAAKHPERLAELRKLYDAWNASVDADCCKLGIEPLFPKETPKDRPQEETLNRGRIADDQIGSPVLMQKDNGRLDAAIDGKPLFTCPLDALSAWREMPSDVFKH
jgi:arylsulfatase A-like enzyme